MTKKNFSLNTSMERKRHYRLSIASFCFPEIIKGLEKVGPFDMPIIRPNYSIPTVVETTPFDRIGDDKSNYNSLVVFYINDNRFFNRLSHPWSYTEKLRQFNGMVAPDLSQYINMDYPRRLSNCYWNKVFAAYWQHENINVYPNVTWSLPDSYDYSMAGLPCNSVIAINSMGVLKHNYSKALWLDGYHYMVKALDPICILRYGPKIFGEDENRSIYLNNNTLLIII